MKKETLAARAARLMPNGVPRYIRCYDSGPDGAIDRYTVVFTRKPCGYRNLDRKTGPCWMYLAMNSAPCHPQGFGQHGETDPFPCDRPNSKQLGKKIKFADLPSDCQKLVLSDYKDHWNLSPPEVTAAQACNYTMDIMMEDTVRNQMTTIADDLANRFGSPAPFMVFLNGWRAESALQPFVAIAEHRVFHENRPFL